MPAAVTTTTTGCLATKKGKKVAAKKVASKAAATQEEKWALRRIRAKRTEHVNLLAKQLQEEANNEGADDHAAGNANSLKDAKQLLLQEASVLSPAK